ncbi:MAG: single-stranded DNA-binding protein, partial [Candidatus Dadabacteria bacterium]|nr:single-stranded DNA-binding protein [Candidatus Dadabacteria bacterium]
MNKVFLAGRIGKDPELRYVGEGTPVCNASLATRRYMGKDKNAGTDWH